MQDARANKQPSARQRALLDHLRAYIAAHGYPPSMRELATTLGYKSVGSIHYQLGELQRLGYVQRDASKPRALEILAASEHIQDLRAEPIFVPLVGRVAAGVPVTAEENVEELLPVPSMLAGRGTTFALRVVGDSMIEACILDRDLVLVRMQSTAEEGEIVVALVDGEASVKVLSFQGGATWLTPRNPAYPRIPGNEATIVGRVVAVMRSL
jgi:repressor LexA